MTCDCGDCWDLPGEFVRHRLTGWLGVIIGDRDAGRMLTVRFLVPRQGLVAAEVSRFEVEPFDDEDGGGGSQAEPEDNIIPVDFTKKVKLTAKTKTRGAA